MYLKALEIQGFKSFPDKTVLNFGEDITAIVGPNGSGKSNISDAIRWVMGEQSSKSLRGVKMEDVIFGGTETRNQMGFAQVTLVLDNTEHIFPSMEETEVAVTRRYYRSGESEYYINKQSVRLRDVNELFMDTGMGREGYSIIGQGRIDEILSQKSGDRREIFEEAAGISRFRYRKEETERKLERTEENLVRINDKIAELELQVDPLRAQAETAKQYLIYRDELRLLEISVWLENLETLRTSAIKLDTDLALAREELNKANADLEALYAASEQFSARIHENDIAQEKERTALSALDAQVKEQESCVAVLQTGIAHNEENIARVEEELRSQSDRVGSMDEQIAQQRARIEELEHDKNEVETTLAALLKQAEELSKNAGEAASEAEALRAREALALSAAADSRAEVAALRSTLSEMDEREKETGEQHVSLTMEMNNLDSRIRLLGEMEKEYEGFNKAVRTVMQASERKALRGVRGPVANLMKVGKKYAVAIEIALGAGLQNIVVEREEDAKSAIQLLKQRDGGRATFLPLSSIRGEALRDARVQNEYGYVGLASELVEYDREYDGIFKNLLGRTVVVEDLDCGITISRRFSNAFRIVTLDGQVLNRGGSMTGGSISRSAGILSRAGELRELTARRGSLAEKLDLAAKAAEDAKRELAKARYELEVAQGQQRAAEDALLKLQGDKNHYDLLLSSLRERLESLDTERETIARRRGEVKRVAEEKEALALSQEKEAGELRAQAEKSLSGQSELLRSTSRLGDEIAEKKSVLAGYAAERETTEKSLASLEGLRAQMQGDEQSRKALIEQYRAASEQSQREIGTHETEIAALSGKMTEKRAELEALSKAKLALEAERSQSDRRGRELNENVLNVERSVSKLEQKRATSAMEEQQILDKLWENYELSHSAAQEQRIELESVAKASRRIGELKRAISGLGAVNVGAIEEFERVNTRYTYLTTQRDDVEKAKGELVGVIDSITSEMTVIFKEQFALIRESFQETFLELFGGGKATLELEDENDVLSCGIEIKVQPPGKALKTITLLSGGEKAFVAIALYFAILKVHPTPFCVMDEIEAALDEPNVVRVANYMRRITSKTQFIVITHRRGTMEAADVLYGVTMQERGVSKVLTINMNDMAKELNIKE